jgi:hypothetical protein
VGHVALMEKKINAYRVVGKKFLERPRRRGKDNN